MTISYSGTIDKGQRVLPGCVSYISQRYGTSVMYLEYSVDDDDDAKGVGGHYTGASGVRYALTVPFAKQKRTALTEPK